MNTPHQSHPLDAEESSPLFYLYAQIAFLAEKVAPDEIDATLERQGVASLELVASIGTDKLNALAELVTTNNSRGPVDFRYSLPRYRRHVKAIHKAMLRHGLEKRKTGGAV